MSGGPLFGPHDPADRLPRVRVFDVSCGNDGPRTCPHCLHDPGSIASHPGCGCGCHLAWQHAHRRLSVRHPIRDAESPSAPGEPATGRIVAGQVAAEPRPLEPAGSPAMGTELPAGTPKSPAASQGAAGSRVESPAASNAGGTAIQWSSPLAGWEHRIVCEGHLFRWTATYLRGQKGEARTDLGLVPGGVFAEVSALVRAKAQEPRILTPDARLDDREHWIRCRDCGWEAQAAALLSIEDCPKCGGGELNGFVPDDPAVKGDA